MPILLFAASLVLVTTASLTLVMSVLHFLMLHWHHGGDHSVAVYARACLPLYAFGSIANILPCLVAGTLLWFYRGTLAKSKFQPRRLLRLAVYPASCLPLLAFAVPARIVSTLFVYASRPVADWATVFWWLQPNGRWSEMVYLRMFETDWFRGGFEWSNPLRFVTIAAIMGLIAPSGLPRLRTAKLARSLGLGVLILLWPVTMVYAGWLASLTVGAQRYLPGQRGWAVGFVSGAVGLLCLLVADTLLGGRGLLDIVQAWP